MRHVRLGAARGVGDRHAESSAAQRDRLPDAAHADDAQARARHLARQRQRPVGPLAVAHEAVRLRQRARHREHQAEGQVGHVVVQHAGRVRDGHAARLGRRDVDAVVADAHHRDQFEGRQPVEQVGADLRLAVRRDRADARGGGRERRRVGLVGTLVQHECGTQRVHQERRQVGHAQHVDLAHPRSPVGKRALCPPSPPGAARPAIPRYNARSLRGALQRG